MDVPWCLKTLFSSSLALSYLTLYSEVTFILSTALFCSSHAPNHGNTVAGWRVRASWWKRDQIVRKAKVSFETSPTFMEMAMLSIFPKQEIP